MTCPHCHVVGSRFSDICIECGARLRSRESAQRFSHSALRPPEVPVQPSQPVAVAPVAIRSRKQREVGAPLRQLGARWSTVALFSVAASPLLAGAIFYRFLSPSPPVAPGPTLAVPSVPVEPVIPIAPILLPPPKPVSPQFENLEKPQASMGRKDVTVPQAIIVRASRPSAENSVVLSSPWDPNTTPLVLQSKYAVPRRTQRQITPLYQLWKLSHQDDASQVDRLLSLYESDAQIYQTPARRISREGLRQLAVATRKAGNYTAVADETPPQWAQNKSGDRVELLAYQRYSDDAGRFTWGQRRLVWQKQGKRWLVIRDDFPPRYIRTAQPEVQLASSSTS